MKVQVFVFFKQSAYLAEIVVDIFGPVSNIVQSSVYVISSISGGRGVVT